MVKIGEDNFLNVVKKEPHGFYLDGGEEFGNILLPTKYAPEDLRIGDEIEVFIYFDSNDTIIATTEEPYAKVGEFASLEVVSVDSEYGVFLDWGLTKDLFVPHREILFKMEVGKKYAVHVYIDSSHRIAASTRITKFLDKSKPQYSAGEPVDLLLFQETELGIKAIVNGRHQGLIYRDDLINGLQLGTEISGYVKSVRPDGKIDLTLKSPDKKNDENLEQEILDKLKKSNGSLAVNAKSSAEVINAEFGVSRKKFKVALGSLYKKKLITITENGITLARSS